MNLFVRLRRLAGRRAHAPGPAPAPQGYALPIEASVRLDQEFGARLESMVEQTEAFAIAIMGQVRGLCDQSSSLVERLQGAAVEVADHGTMVAAGAAEVLGQLQYQDIVASASSACRRPPPGATRPSARHLRRRRRTRKRLPACRATCSTRILPEKQCMASSPGRRLAAEAAFELL